MSTARQQTESATGAKTLELPGRSPGQLLASTPRRDELAALISQRIESRLGGRIRNLRVTLEGDVIVLAGTCTTYYSKQLAQHAALGVIEDEPLENRILVTLCD